MHPDRPGRRPADEPAPARGPPRHRRLGQARLPGRHARPDRRHHLLRDDPQRVRRALPGARGLRAGDPGRDRATSRRLGPDGLPNTADDVVVNKYVTDHWQQPNASQDPQADGNTFTPELQPDPRLHRERHHVAVQPRPSGPNCLEVPLTGAADQGRHVRRRLRLRRLLPERLRPGRRRRHLQRRDDPVPLVAGDLHRPRDHADGPDRHARLQPGEPGRAPERHRRARERPRRRQRLPLPHRPRGGRQRRPRQPASRRDPAAALHRRRPRDRPVDAGHRAAPTSASPARTRPLCDKHLVVLQNGQNANADFNLMTNFRTDPNGEDAERHADRRRRGARPGRRPGLQRHLLRAQPDVASGTASRARSANIPIGIYARVDTVCRRRTCNRHAPYDANNWRLITTVTTSPDGVVRGAAALDRDVQLPDPAGTLPGHVHRDRRRPGHARRTRTPNYNPNLLTANTPSEVWPGLTDPARHAARPDLGHGLRGPSAGGTTPDPLEPGRARAAPGLAAVRARGRQRHGPPDHDPRRLHRHRRDRDRRNRRARGHADRRPHRRRSTTLTRANGGIVSWTPGTGSTPDTIVIQRPGAQRDDVPGRARSSSRSSPPNAERRRVERQRHHPPRAGLERHRRERSPTTRRS